jgi:hypothetical protein
MAGRTTKRKKTVKEGTVLSAKYQAEEDELARLERAVEELKTAYEHYFSGLEKREPGKLRETTHRLFLRSKLSQAMRTQIRFRFGNLQQRYGSFCNYWDRVTREIETGAFKREGWKRFELGPLTPERVRSTPPPNEPETEAAAAIEADTPAEATPPQEPKPSEAAQEAEAFLASLGVAPKPRSAARIPARPAASPAPPPLPPPLPAEALRTAPGGREMRALFDSYVEARRTLGQDPTKVPFDRFAASVERQVSHLKDTADVNLRVEIRDGRPAVVAKHRVDPPSDPKAP